MAKNIIGTIAFFVGFAIIFNYFNSASLWENGVKTGFESTEVASRQIYEWEYKDKYDVVFIGSSHAYCTFYPKILWQQHGIASHVFASSGQEIYVSELYVKETIKNQKPKVIVLEVISASMDNGFVMGANNEFSIVHSYSALAPSIDKLETLFYAFDEASLADKFYPLFPIVTFHENWKYSDYDNFNGIDFEKYQYNYGAVLHDIVIDGLQEPQNLPENSIDFSEKAKQSLMNIIDICEENDIELIFTVAPYTISEQSQQVMNKVEEIALENGIPFINYNNLYDEIDIDFSKDFKDAGHLNIYGMEKISAHFGNFLKDNFEISDRRGDENYNDYDLAEERELILTVS